MRRPVEELRTHLSEWRLKDSNKDLLIRYNDDRPHMVHRAGQCRSQVNPAFPSRDVIPDPTGLVARGLVTQELRSEDRGFRDIWFCANCMMYRPRRN
jgi:hypothetical protein